MYFQMDAGARFPVKFEFEFKILFYFEVELKLKVELELELIPDVPQLFPQLC